MGAAEDAVLVGGEGEEVPGDALVSLQKAAVHMGGEEPDSPGQVFQHGHGQIGVSGKDRRQVGPVHRHQFASGHRHRRGHPGLPVKERGLADEVAAVVEGEGALVSVLGGEKTLYRTL